MKKYTPALIVVAALASALLVVLSLSSHAAASQKDVASRAAIPSVVQVTYSLESPFLDKNLIDSARNKAAAIQEDRAEFHLAHLEHLARIRAKALAARDVLLNLAQSRVQADNASLATASPPSTSRKTPTTVSTPYYSSKAAGAFAWALSQAGCPYVWGGTSCSSGFDCSGLVMMAYEHVGIQLPRTTYDMLSSGMLIQVSNPQPGDLAFYGSGHVELYARSGVTFGAHNSGTVVGYINEWEIPTYYRVGLA